jgi:PAS domain S-box-containing protein
MRSFQMGLLDKAERKVKAYYEEETQRRTNILIVLIALSVLIVILTSVLLRYINRSLIELKDASLKMAHGETDIQLDVLSHDQIGSLAASINTINEKLKQLAADARSIGEGNFNVSVQPRSETDLLGNAILQMKQNLQRSREALIASREDFKALADFMPQVVWTARADGNIDYFNHHWFELTGLKENYSEQYWIKTVHPEDVGLFLTRWYQSVETGETFELEFRLINIKRGNYCWHLARAVSIKDEEDKVVKWFGTATDIDDQKKQKEKLEETVATRTLDLSRSNEDLRQFAHVASHDLKEPLRKIRTFSDRLELEYAQQLPDTAKIYVEKIAGSASRMSELIDSILTYSVVNSTEQHFETVDINLIMEGIENDLELLIVQKNVKIIYKDLPKIRAVPALIHQLFYNLVNNSIKFSRPNVPPVIEITAEILSKEKLAGFKELSTKQDYYSIIVRDNGIGFAQAYAHKMFEVFSRLNARDKYEGTGLGLALCKKIVQRHNGYIYAEGKEAAGAAFHIILPAAATIE